MKTLYLDIFSGMSGDMFIGAMIDLGVDMARLEQELSKLGLGGYHLHVRRAFKASIEGVKFDVHMEPGAAEGTHAHKHGGASHGHDHHDPAEHAKSGADAPKPFRETAAQSGQGHSHPHSHVHEHEHTHADGTQHSHPHGHVHAHEHSHPLEEEHHHEHGRSFADIQRLVESSALSEWVKEKTMSVFRRVAVAEGRIHGQSPEQVHFHEVGALDSIVDIVGACVCLEMLSKPRVLAGPVVEGCGWVDCAHGRFPVPAPATLEILGARRIPLSQCDEPQELLTPTGAALLAEFVESFAPMQNLVAARIGYGLGTRDNRTRPNVLRAVLSDETAGAAHDWEADTVAVLETNLDDINAEILGHFVERALQAGALDVFHIPVQMKKNRPGVLLTVLCRLADAEQLSELILSETSAFGVRCTRAERRKLKRESATVHTPFGEIVVKIGRLNGKPLQVAPEFESCRKAADQGAVPLKLVYDAALRAAHEAL